MISDSVLHWRRYFSGSPWDAAFAFLETLGPTTADREYLEIGGPKLFARIMSYPTRAPENAVVEAHNQFTDVQMSLVNAEGIEWYRRDRLEALGLYDGVKDAVYFRRPHVADGIVYNVPGRFSVFFPQDAHMAQLAVPGYSGNVKKVVVKIHIDLL